MVCFRIQIYIQQYYSQLKILSKEYMLRMKFFEAACLKYKNKAIEYYISIGRMDAAPNGAKRLPRPSKNPISYTREQNE